MSSTPSFCSRSERRRGPRRAVPALAALAAALIAGCGGSDDADTAPESAELPEPSRLIRIAVADGVETVDPVYARTRTERMISRQIYEPLVSRVSPPFGDAGTRTGPARPVRTEEDGSLWRFELRPGVVFQDGSPLNAEAVIGNFQRWVLTGVAADVVPELMAVDAPEPGQVRFQLSQPVPDFPRRLGDPRLGLVSLPAIEVAGVDPIPVGPSGTGAYELRESRATRLLLVRSVDWWGEAAGLGPGINQLDFLVVPEDRDRLAQLSDGTVRIADHLGVEATRLLARRPLLGALSVGGPTIGYSNAVRGLTKTRPDQPLSGLWLTDLR